MLSEVTRGGRLTIYAQPKTARVSCSVKSEEKYTTKLIKPKEWHRIYK